MRWPHRHDWELIGVRVESDHSSIRWRCRKCGRLGIRHIPGGREDAARYLEGVR